MALLPAISGAYFSLFWKAVIQMKQSKAASLLLAAALAALCLSLAVAVPILVRPFYYIQIDLLDLPEKTGWSETVIREAYDQVLDFCVFGKPFGTGTLAWSESGRSHFADVRSLFLLDFTVLGLSAALSAVLLILRATGRFSFFRFLRRGPSFWAGMIAGGLVLLIGALAATNFQRAFTIFHTIFFPGKDNWIFDPSADQIILVMPETFFRNCAILIMAVFIFCCIVLIIADRFAARHIHPSHPQTHKTSRRT